MAPKRYSKNPPSLSADKKYVLNKLSELIEEGLEYKSREVAKWFEFGNLEKEVEIWSEVTEIFLTKVFDDDEYLNRFVIAVSTRQVRESDPYSEQLKIIRRNLKLALDELSVILRLAEILDESKTGSDVSSAGKIAQEVERDTFSSPKRGKKTDPQTTINDDQLSRLTFWGLLELHPWSRNLIVGVIVAIPIIVVVLILLAVLGILDINLGPIQISKPPIPE